MFDQLIQLYHLKKGDIFSDMSLYYYFFLKDVLMFFNFNKMLKLEAIFHMWSKSFTYAYKKHATYAFFKCLLTQHCRIKVYNA